MGACAHRSFIICALLVSFVLPSLSIRFDLGADEEKCFSEEISDKVLVVVEFSGDEKFKSVKMYDPNMDKKIEAENTAGGKHAFKTKMAGDYKICFDNINGSKMSGTLQLKTGVEVQDYSQTAKREKLSQIEVDLRRMENRVQEIMTEMNYMRKREEEMRETSESTNFRVLWFSIFSVAVLVGLGLWQVYYLKHFFREKKLM